MRRAVGALALLLAAGGCVQEMDFTWRPGSGVPKVCSPGEQRACPYSGPEETNGVGMCKAAVMTCSADGSGFGPCDDGEVTPQLENCATPEDEDCDGSTSPCGGSCVWSKAFGDVYYQEGTSITVDTSTGEVIVAGLFGGTLDFGGGPLASGGVAMFLAKLGGDGAHRWSYAFGTSSDLFLPAVDVDATGSLHAASSFQGSVDFGAGPLVSDGLNWSVFAATRSADGSPSWSFDFGGVGYQRVWKVAVDDDNSTIIAGDFFGTIDFGGATLTSVGGYDAFVAKLDPSGGHLWSRAFGGPDMDAAHGVTVDSIGNVLVAGAFEGAVDFGGGPLTSKGDSDVFVTKLDPDGAHVWTRAFGNNQPQLIDDIAMDRAGNAMILVGSFTGPLDFGGGPLLGDNAINMFVVKLAASDGDYVWSKRFGDASYKHPWARVTVSNTGNVILAGAFGGSVDFGGGPLAAIGDDVFVAKLAADSSHLWSKRFGDPDDLVRAQWAMSLATDTAENLFLTGNFDGQIDFGCGTHSSAGNTDAFVVRLSP